MTVVRKYPTAYNNPDNWIDPAYADGVEDNLCASKSLSGAGSRESLFYVSGFGFAIPADAIIDSVIVGCKCGKWGDGIGIAYVYPNDAFMELIIGYFPTAASCALTSWITLDVTTYLDNGFNPVGWTPAKLNGELFSAYVHLYQEYPNSITAYMDAYYIEVTYHVPVVAKKPLMDGFIFIE